MIYFSTHTLRYTGKVFYSVKDMVTEGSSAKRGITETSLALESQFKKLIPPCVYIYADGAGDRKNTNFKVQKGLISLFVKHDLDEVVAARPAAGDSYQNSVERCHWIAIFVSSQYWHDESKARYRL